MYSACCSAQTAHKLVLTSYAKQKAGAKFTVQIYILCHYVSVHLFPRCNWLGQLQHLKKFHGFKAFINDISFISTYYNIYISKMYLIYVYSSHSKFVWQVNQSMLHHQCHHFDLSKKAFQMPKLPWIESVQDLNIKLGIQRLWTKLLIKPLKIENVKIWRSFFSVEIQLNLSENDSFKNIGLGERLIIDNFW